MIYMNYQRKVTTPGFELGTYHNINSQEQTQQELISTRILSFTYTHMNKMNTQIDATT